MKVMALFLGSFFLINSGTALAEDSKQTNSLNTAEKKAEVVRLAGELLNMRMDELNRAFLVIVESEANTEAYRHILDMSDKEALALVDHSEYPYDSIDSKKSLATAKRFELEARLLAEKANVPYEKFRSFYLNFPKIIAAADKISSDELEIFPSAEVIEITCDYSCRFLDNGIIKDYNVVFGYNQDSVNYESALGSLPLGSRIIIKSPNNPNTVTVRKQLSSITWGIQSSNVVSCGGQPCLQPL